MQKSRMALAVLAVIPLVFGGCVSKSEYMKTVESANALEVDNARLKTELANAGKRNEQVTADRAELERLLAARSGELGRSIAELRQRLSAIESENIRLAQELSEIGVILLMFGIGLHFSLKDLLSVRAIALATARVIRLDE